MFSTTTGGLSLSQGRGSLVVKVTDSWQVYHEFKTSTTEDPPCREAMHVKSVESSSVLPLVWCGSQERRVPYQKHICQIETSDKTVSWGNRQEYLRFVSISDKKDIPYKKNSSIRYQCLSPQDAPGIVWDFAEFCVATQMEQEQLFREFFDPLLGSENLSLTDRGRRIAWTIFSAATREEKKLKGRFPEPKPEETETLQSQGNNFLHSTDDMTETLEKLKKDLWEIINLFQKVSDARDEFSTHFYGWSFLRLKCIAELEYLKTSLDYALYRCDIYEAVTGSLKLAAGLFFTSSIVLAEEGCWVSPQQPMIRCFQRETDLETVQARATVKYPAPRKGKHDVKRLILHYLVGRWYLTGIEVRAQPLHLRSQKCTNLRSNYRPFELDVRVEYSITA
ncbi:uncharacterized protein TNCV_1101531 [Trichonephila clavipes]|nr:uncharacterized protein TNCV_1101531 [Trichonephila clavipes]